MCTLAISEGPDKMLHNVAFHQGLHCLLRQKWFSENEIQVYLEITVKPVLRGHLKLDKTKVVMENDSLMEV